MLHFPSPRDRGDLLRSPPQLSMAGQTYDLRPRLPTPRTSLMHPLHPGLNQAAAAALNLPRGRFKARHLVQQSPVSPQQSPRQGPPDQLRHDASGGWAGGQVEPRRRRMTTLVPKLMLPVDEMDGRPRVRSMYLPSTSTAAAAQLAWCPQADRARGMVPQVQPVPPPHQIMLPAPPPAAHHLASRPIGLSARRPPAACVQPMVETLREGLTWHRGGTAPAEPPFAPRLFVVPSREAATQRGRVQDTRARLSRAVLETPLSPARVSEPHAGTAPPSNGHQYHHDTSMFLAALHNNRTTEQAVERLEAQTTKDATDRANTEAEWEAMLHKQAHEAAAAAQVLRSFGVV